ncbi:MAG TPA: hypothetical protein PL089_15425 [Ignavibacteria bacterium]|nr:hypothetical protein [Ignavibacteria bacterium]
MKIDKKTDLRKFNKGQPKKKNKRVKVAITMTPQHYKLTAGGNRSAMVEQGLKLILK